MHGYLTWHLCLLMFLGRECLVVLLLSTGLVFPPLYSFVLVCLIMFVLFRVRAGTVVVVNIVSSISETSFHIFIVMASRRLQADRFFTKDFTPEVEYSSSRQYATGCKCVLLSIRATAIYIPHAFSQLDASIHAVSQPRYLFFSHSRVCMFWALLCTYK